MNHLSPPALAVKSSLREDLPSERDWLLSSLRTAATRSRLKTSLLETIHVALRQKRIDCAGAVKWLEDEGLLGDVPGVQR
jgi:hypothetical protein